MTTSQWKEIQKLFDEAVALPPEEWAAFLDRACDDPDVRGNVESLLEHDRKAPAGFMYTPDVHAKVGHKTQIPPDN